MSRYGFGSNVHTLGGSSRRSSVARSSITFDDTQNIHFVNYLIDNGADPNILNKYGENAYTIAYRVNNKSIIDKIKELQSKQTQDFKNKAVGWEREAGRLKRKCDDHEISIERYKKTIKQQDITIDRLEGENIKLKKDNAKLKTSVGKLMKLTKK